jgi:hypothetical protein
MYILDFLRAVFDFVVSTLIVSICLYAIAIIVGLTWEISSLLYGLLIQPLLDTIYKWLHTRPSDKVVDTVKSIGSTARTDIANASTDYLDDVIRNARR